jgi:hypothetical protein
LLEIKLKGFYFGGFLDLWGYDSLREALKPPEFLDLFSQITDRRRAQGKNWQLGPVILATVLAILSGATSYRKVHGFMAIHRTRLNAAFGFGWPVGSAAGQREKVHTRPHGTCLGRAFWLGKRFRHHRPAVQRICARSSTGQSV